MKRVLVTGAAGFVGSMLCDALVRSGYGVRAAVRDVSRAPDCVADRVLIEDLGFLGGVGTDPNNMIPFIVLATGCYLALSRTTAQAATAGLLSAGGALDAPLGMTLAPDGDLIVVNGINGNAVEITAAGHQLTTRTLVITKKPRIIHNR